MPLLMYQHCNHATVNGISPLTRLQLMLVLGQRSVLWNWF